MSAPVQPVGAEAAPRLAALHAEAFEAPWSAEALASLLASPFVFGLLAEGEGFILVQAVAGEAEILTLAVRPAARGCGVGLSLVHAAEEAVVALGAESLWLEVAEDNAAARALYARAGFTEAGRRSGYYAGPDGAKDALVLSRRLNSGAG